MSDDQTSEKSSYRVAWVIACLVLLLASVVLLKRSTQRGAVIVTLDTNGTARFAVVLPLQNTNVRNVAFGAMKYLNNGTGMIVSSKSGSLSNLAELANSMRSSGITSVFLRIDTNSLKTK